MLDKQNVNQDHDDEIDLLKVAGTLLDYKYLIIGLTALAMVLGVAVALLSTPVYKADALLQVEEKSPGVSGLLEMSDMFSQESSASTEIEIINSRMVLGQAVAENNLDIIVKPHYFPLIGEYLARTRPTPLDENVNFDNYSWGNEKINVAELSVPNHLSQEPITLRVITNTEYELLQNEHSILKGNVGILEDKGEIRIKVTELHARPNTLFTVAKKSRLASIADIKRRLSVSERGKGTGILQVSMTGSNRAEIEQTLNSVVQAYFLQNVKRQAAEAENSVEFLNQQLPKVKNALNQAEEALNEHRLKTESVDLALETEGVLKSVVELEKQLNELRLKEAEVSRLYTRSHPTYQSLQEQIARLEKDKQELSAKIKKLPETQQQLLRLRRDVEVNQEIYLALLNKSQELNIMKASTVGNVRILDDAAVQPEPIKPKKSLIVIFSTLLGGMLSVGLVMLIESFRKGIKTSAQLEQAGVNVYATVPRSELQIEMEAKLKKLGKKKDDNLPLLIKEDPTDLTIEAIRSLRTSLHFAMLEAKNNIVMISGPSAGVGKSFLSANLASIIANADKKVLLIDADMRRGFTHSYFNVPKSPGLSDILSNQSELSTVINKEVYGQLDFISRGMNPPNPSELLMHENFKALLDWAKENYDLVMIDTPPILAVTDSAIVGQLVGTTLLTVEFENNTIKETEEAIRRLERNGVEVKGVVLNKVVKKNSLYDYGYDYAYHYRSVDEK